MILASENTTYVKKIKFDERSYHYFFSQVQMYVA